MSVGKISARLEFPVVVKLINSKVAYPSTPSYPIQSKRLSLWEFRFQVRGDLAIAPSPLSFRRLGPSE
jgi:hypothetical protein